MALLPGSRLGTYVIVSRLGAGGMGEVYKARDERLDLDTGEWQRRNSDLLEADELDIGYRLVVGCPA